MVSREILLSHPKRFYEKCQEWLITTQWPSAISGRVFEYVWHIMFGKSCCCSTILLVFLPLYVRTHSLAWLQASRRNTALQRRFVTVKCLDEGAVVDIKVECTCLGGESRERTCNPNAVQRSYQSLDGKGVADSCSDLPQGTKNISRHIPIASITYNFATCSVGRIIPKLSTHIKTYSYINCPITFIGTLMIYFILCCTCTCAMWFTLACQS